MSLVSGEMGDEANTLSASAIAASTFMSTSTNSGASSGIKTCRRTSSAHSRHKSHRSYWQTAGLARQSQHRRSAKRLSRFGGPRGDGGAVVPLRCAAKYFCASCCLCRSTAVAGFPCWGGEEGITWSIQISLMNQNF